jgi:DNA-binding NtrC family response regulator
LFLDEVGELPLPTQAKLLRVLETGEFIRMGASQVQKTEVRVVAATNKDLPRAIRNGRFREDLYYRLNTVEIKVPALRERKEDIPLLFRKFAVDSSQKYRMPPIRLNDEATAMLRNYYWNGNIRQLKNVAEQISVIETNHDITAEILSKYLPKNQSESALMLAGDRPTGDPFMNEREMLYKVLFDMKRDIAELKQQVQGQNFNVSHAAPMPTSDTPIKMRDDYSDYQMAEEVKEDSNNTLAETERQAIMKALQHNAGNRKRAAEELGLSERTLYRKIKDYGL